MYQIWVYEDSRHIGFGGDEGDFLVAIPSLFYIRKKKKKKAVPLPAVESHIVGPIWSVLCMLGHRFHDERALQAPVRELFELSSFSLKPICLLLLLGPFRRSSSVIGS